MFPKSRQVELDKARKFAADISDEDADDDLRCLSLWRSFCETMRHDPVTGEPLGIFEDYEGPDNPNYKGPPEHCSPAN